MGRVIRKKRVPCRSTEDIISNLPCNIIDNILICLPVRDAARTSILSRKWRFKWLSISQLVFDSVKDEFFRSISPTSPKQIWSRIYQILLLHDGPLHKLVLSVDEVVENQICILNQIILFLTRKGIQEFDLHPPNMRRSFPLDMFARYTIPSTLFMCTHLSHLKIIDCALRLPPEYTGFSKLVSLQLDSVYFTSNDFKTFLSKCPLLQRLRLENCADENIGGENHIEIDAPNLKFLYSECRIMSFSFDNVPVLSTLIIKKSFITLAPYSNVVKVFGSLPAIEYFSADGYFLMDLTSSIVPERLPVMLNQLKCAELCGLNLSYSKDVKFALLVIRSSPNLLKLKIELDDEYESYVNDVPINLVEDSFYELLNVNDVPINLVEDSFDQLCEVMITNFTGMGHQWEFIEFLLAKSLVLEKIMIQPSIRIAEKKVIQILKALLQYQSTSKKAQIIFLDSAKEVSQMFSYRLD